jgi:DNA primase
MEQRRTDIRAIKERSDIVSIISRYVSLTKSGANYKGRCPFHKDDTPSMMVNAEKGLWHCFGCGEGGDIIAFLMKIERLSFIDAARRLAAEAGMDFDVGETGQQETLRAIMAEVAAYYAGNLTSEASGRKAREYLIGRGFPEESWETYGLGYAPPGWENVKRRYAKKYGVQELLDLGLLIEGKSGTYDRFRDRVMFPIFDLSGRPIAFGGRAFDGEPKYLNSPKTALFDKSRVLYGLSWARDAMTTARSAVLVEGYTDVLSLHHAGITNVVGSMGTSLTQGQARILGRFVSEVVIAYDRDAAGGAASLRGMQILRNNGINVRVARLAEGDDPDGLVRAEGAEAMRAVIDAAIPFHRFYIESLAEEHDLETVIGKERALQDAREFIHDIRSLPLKHEIARSLAEILDLPLESVQRELSRRRTARVEEVSEETSRAWGAEEVLLALLLREEVGWDRIAAHVNADQFSSENRAIAEALASSPESPTISDLIEQLDEDSARRASFFALAPVQFSNAEQAVQDALSRMVKLPSIERRLRDVEAEMDACEKSGDWERHDELLREKVALVAERLARKGMNGQAKDER